jgi:hypothetical protein
MKTTFAVTAAIVPTLLSGVAHAQGGTMMDGHWGSGWMYGYGFPWVPALVIAAIVGFAVWLVRYKGK